jgi:hypothetical protein
MKNEQSKAEKSVAKAKSLFVSSKDKKSVAKIKSSFLTSKDEKCFEQR